MVCPPKTLAEPVNQTLNWEGCLNARDVGGLPVVGGGQTRWNSLLRADSLGHLTWSGLEAVRSRSVSRIIDLRYPGEGNPDPATASHPFAQDGIYHPIPMFDPAVADIDPALLRNGTIAEVYCVSADHNGSRIASAIAAIASAPSGPVVVHCAAGKDRTGIVVALALRIAGVGLADIAADYAATARLLAPRLAVTLAKEPDPDRREFIQRWHATEPETMLALLGHIDRRYAGAGPYLQSHGVDDAQLSALRDRLTSAP